MNCDIIVFESKEDACLELSDMLSDLAKKGGTVALSGGSTPKLLFSLIKKEHANEDWSRLKFFWGDERMVPSDSSESNYGEFWRIMSPSGIIPASSVFAVPFYGSSQNDEKKSLAEYEQTIKKQVPFSNNLPQFDLVILGIGTDGHTASIFPNNLQSFESSNIIEAVSHPSSQQRRITLTGSSINNAKSVVILCTGSDKQNIISDLLIEDNMNLPANLVAAQDELLWFLDEDAAKLLEEEDGEAE